ncbi:MAG: prolyl-tRNA synthetase associated domain-containing protein [Candidatus Aminicenantes bacterium]|nr:MAG: prolyl-tRNA synthetase associated domain-containing protein [Candidatus Aminicenantes bacterium]
MALSESEKRVYGVLDKLGISYIRHEHPPVYTVEEAEKQWTKIIGAHCKNLFLRNKKGNRHYLVILEASKVADLKSLNKILGEDRLSFASEKRLMKYLGLETGAVSAFGLIYDKENHVKVVIDDDLKKAEAVNFHPNVNTATVGISFPDFERFLAWCGHAVRYLPFE